MKIYNKKGFFSGLFTTAIGVALLAAGVDTGFEHFDLKMLPSSFSACLSV